MCDYNSAPQAPVRSNNSLALPFTFWSLFQKMREPVLPSKKMLENAHSALEGSAHLTRLPHGFRIYATVREHQTLLICQKQTISLVFTVSNTYKLS